MKKMIILAAVLASVRCLAQQPDIVLADFEGPDYGAWKTTGTAFGNGPAPGAVDGQWPVTGFQGKGLASSFHGADGAIGTLTSPEFKLERKFITFLIGGGNHAGKTCMNLLVAGKIVRTAAGENAEKLGPTAWDVRDLADQTAQIQVVDNATGGMGHLMVDQIVQTDRAGQPIANVTREFVADNQYLNIPISNRGEERFVTWLVDGQPVSKLSAFRISLADGKPDWWAFYDISAFKGHKLSMTVNKLREDSTALSAIEQSDEIKDVAGEYQKPRRPQLYFSPLRAGCGDANGLVYYQGEYHLFFQHDPFGHGGARNSHWGHAVSADLVHWKQLADAIGPDENGMCYSGSAAVDWNNTSGLQTGSEKPMIIAYCGTATGQCLAYSNDRGRTWLRHPGNPVVPYGEPGSRDPKLFWHEPTKKWVMVVCYGWPGNQTGKPSTNPNYGIYISPDLKTWERTSTLYMDNTTDCPELFEIPVDGNKAKTKWIFYSGDAYYLVGTFDGKTFTQESGPHKLNRGNSFYASQTFSDIPKSDGRRILMAAASGGGRGSGFGGAISMAVELTLRTTDEGLRLYTHPVKELETLRVKAHDIAPQPLKPGVNPLADIHGELMEVVADVAVGNASKIIFNLRGVPVTYDATKQELTCQDRAVPLKLVDGHVRLRAYVDRTAIMLFPNDGRFYMPMGVSADPKNLSLDLSASGDGAKIQSLQVYELKSIWETSGD
jgi:sucrose-6-phosphate hydrolase SacC (GH32 family)